MSESNDLWSEIGSLSEEDASHVLTRLFTFYELEAEQNPESECCRDFFKKLATSIDQTLECNLNRR